MRDSICAKIIEEMALFASCSRFFPTSFKAQCLIRYYLGHSTQAGLTPHKIKMKNANEKMHSHSKNCCHVGVLRVLEEAKHNDIPAKKGIFTSCCFTHHRFISLQKEKKSQTVNAMTFSLNTKKFDLTHPHNHRSIFLHILFSSYTTTPHKLTHQHTHTLMPVTQLAGESVSFVFCGHAVGTTEKPPCQANDSNPIQRR